MPLLLVTDIQAGGLPAPTLEQRRHGQMFGRKKSALGRGLPHAPELCISGLSPEVESLDGSSRKLGPRLDQRAW
jgi:hypothetical protein